MESVFFSIIIPVFNRGSFIQKTVLSALSQTFTDFEIIIIDDGSTDNTAGIIKNHFEKNALVKYYYQQNLERGAARNEGIKRAQGKYIVFLDSDDIFKKNHLEVLYKNILLFPEVNFIATKYIEINEHDKIVYNPLNQIKHGWYDYRFFLKGSHLACNFCIKRENPNLKYFIEDRRYAIMEDWLFLVENLFKDKLLLIDETTILMLDHESRSMRSNNEKIIKKRLMATDYLIDNLNLVPGEVNILKGYSYYFCAIHYYLDSNRQYALKFLLMSFGKIGIKIKIFKLLLKIVLGINLINNFKKCL